MRRRLFLSILPAGACSTEPAPRDCEREAARVRELIRRGELAEGLARTEACLARLEATVAPVPADRFRILQSEILISQGRADAGLDVLAAVEVSELGDADRVAYWMHRGYGSAVVRRFEEGRRHLDTAEKLSAQLSARPWAPDIALRVGTLEARTGDLETAELRFRGALSLARESGDRFVEAMALGSLGRVYLGGRRYDQALDFFSRSLAINVAIDSKNAMAKDLGTWASATAGWAATSWRSRAISARSSCTRPPRIRRTVSVGWAISATCVSGGENSMRRASATGRRSRRPARSRPENRSSSG